jgi:hypothetical protein
MHWMWADRPSLGKGVRGKKMPHWRVEREWLDIDVLKDLEEMGGLRYVERVRTHDTTWVGSLLFEGDSLTQETLHTIMPKRKRVEP